MALVPLMKILRNIFLGGSIQKVCILKDGDALRVVENGSMLPVVQLPLKFLVPIKLRQQSLQKISKMQFLQGGLDGLGDPFHDFFEI